MPTNTNAYNSRVTDEALEKRFRDTFRSQGGAELVDDLYAQGVIVPIVDFTQAATGDVLAENLQTAWDFTTGHSEVSGTSATIISNAGFWQVDWNCTIYQATALNIRCSVNLTDGLTSKTLWQMTSKAAPSTDLDIMAVEQQTYVIFVRSGDSVSITSSSGNAYLNASWRQIATVNGDLVDPSGFTSS